MSVTTKSELQKKRKKSHKAHGDKGVYCGGNWIPIEECADWICPKECSQNKAQQTQQIIDDENIMYDVAIIGAGCIGTTIARELSKYSLKIILLERDDDVTQGATKGNSGIIHAGYDDPENSIKSKFCWKGNQMFPQLDKELKFGYLRNGSLVIARSKDDYQHLKKLLERGRKNGVKNLKIIEKTELHQMEPYLSDDCCAALYSPDAGTVTPYEFTIALAENAACNGVQIRTRHEVIDIKHNENENYFDISIKKWSYQATSNSLNVSVDNAARRVFNEPVNINIFSLNEFRLLLLVLLSVIPIKYVSNNMIIYIVLVSIIVILIAIIIYKMKGQSSNDTDKVLFYKSDANQNGDKSKPNCDTIIRSKYIINCGGLFADRIAAMVSDYSFKIKPRLGEYLLLHKDCGHLARCTLFPCPGPMGKGVLVQTTLWGNLILGPTARDVHETKTQKDTPDDIIKSLLKKSMQLVPSIDPSYVIHSFAGARAKSDRGDWIIEQTAIRNKLTNNLINFFNVAGIDSPGLAGSPSIAQYVVDLLKKSGLILNRNKLFNPYRRPLIFPKNGWKGLKLKKYDKNNRNGININNETEMKKNVVCKCEKVTEYEIYDSMNRFGVNVDTTQAIRRRTRAGMGYCQADPNNVNCEQHVAKIISQKTNININNIGRRGWPATSILKQRWLDDNDKKHLQSLID